MAEATARLEAAQASAAAGRPVGARRNSAQHRLDAARAREADLVADRLQVKSCGLPTGTPGKLSRLFFPPSDITMATAGVEVGHQCLPTLAKLEPTLAQTWQIRADDGRVRPEGPNVGRFGRTCSELGETADMTWAEKISQTSKCGATLHCLTHVWPKLRQIRPTANIGQVGWDSGRLSRLLGQRCDNGGASLGQRFGICSETDRKLGCAWGVCSVVRHMQAWGHRPGVRSGARPEFWPEMGAHGSEPGEGVLPARSFACLFAGVPSRSGRQTGSEPR